jgi:rsbT co-antagonist protein RsbR
MGERPLSNVTMNDAEISADDTDLACCLEALERERAARKEAERLAEEVSLEHAELLDGLEAAKEEVLAANREVLRLSTLVLPVWPDVLLMPIIGRVDHERAELLCQTIVEEAARTGAKVAILDLSGVPSVDTYMARRLPRFHEALRLVGSQMVLCGLSPQVAQSAARSGQDEEDGMRTMLRFPIRRTLSDALSWAIDNTQD